jgi:glycogen debranching enzyme
VFDGAGARSRTSPAEWQVQTHQAKENTTVPATTRTAGEEIVRVATKGKKIEQLLRREWLLTNERGSFSSSTIAACNTSGYHGLLVGSPDPLVRRMMTLSNCLETVRWNGQAVELSTFEFSDRFAPEGYTHLEEFSRDTGAHFVFRTEPVDLCKSIYLAGDSDTVVIEYTFGEVRAAIDFVLRPFVGMRDFHVLQTSDAPLACRIAEGAVLIQNERIGDCELLLSSAGMGFESDPQWWFNFTYRVNKGRGQPHTEDLWAPGFFKGHVDRPGRIVFWARLGGRGDLIGGASPLASESRAQTSAFTGTACPRLDGGHDLLAEADAIKENLLRHQEQLMERAGAQEKAHRILCLAADQFVVKRKSASGERTTIVAGFPWFADWGRDTFISLPGLLLATGRPEEAGSVLGTFAAAVDEGMIPNRFDDRTGQAQFNSVDASLWFIHAAFAYLDATEDPGEFSRQLLPAIRSIIDSYHAGTRFDIHADSDGLITAGDKNTQLTWMDAKCDGVAFTPRYGKAVEINALWHNAICLMQRFCAQQAAADAGRYAAMAEQVGRSFCKLFWNVQQGYLNDTVLPDGTVDASLRPNQIFAVSLPFSPPLTRSQQWAVVNVVEQKLLTPYGPRTLSSRDPAYKGRYEGSTRQRDEAYHQGTVWPYLMGPFLDAYLRIRGHSEEARSNVAELIRPLLRHMVEDGCLGSISEVFDGDPPHKPGGCCAQAWSVAELLRIYRIVATE